jgi:hypothetical protein
VERVPARTPLRMVVTPPKTSRPSPREQPQDSSESPQVPLAPVQRYKGVSATLEHDAMPQPLLPSPPTHTSGEDEERRATSLPQQGTSGVPAGAPPNRHAEGTPKFQHRYPFPTFPQSPEERAHQEITSLEKEH